MASLNWSELKKYSHRIDKLLSNIDSKTPFELTNGQKKVLSFYTIDPNVIKFEKDLRTRGVNASSPTRGMKPLVDSTGNLYSLGDLKKTVDFGGSGENRGNVAEGILAAALAARFLSKTKRITPQDVTAIISKFPKSGNPGFKQINLLSPNDNPQVVDKLNVFVELAEADMKNFLNKTYTDLLNSSVAYANQANVMKWADLLYTNNTLNTINIKSMGISGQTSTKVDTWVEVGDNDQTPERIDVNISLKAGDVKQFGQEAGMKWEAQERLWGNFGLVFNDSIKKKFIELVAKKDYVKAFDLTFREAANKLNSTGVDSKTVAQAIIHYATLNESNVDLLQLKGNVAIEYRFSKAVDLISPLNLKADLTFGSSNLPTLTFVVLEGGPLVKIRVKKSGEGYFRSIIEKEKVMTEILAFKYS